MQFTSTLAKQYQSLFDSCQVRPSKLAIVETITNKIVANRVRYSLVQDSTRVPWWFIGIVHSLEGGINFRTHLHNGDPLTARTKQVPKGRPKLGSPPFTWEESAIDALTYQGLANLGSWTLPETLFRFEEYNGWGYRNRGINTPYLWSFTTNYFKGKFVADGKYDPNAVSQQVGAAAVMKLLSKSFELFVGAGDTSAIPPRPFLKLTLPHTTGQAVRVLQAQLNAHGLNVTVDGVFGHGTEKAVRRFQSQKGLAVDGRVGPRTWDALLAK